MQISSSGNILLQNAFLQSHCFNGLPSPTAIEVSNIAVDALRTVAYRSTRDHIFSPKFPSVTILDFSWVGSC